MSSPLHGLNLIIPYPAPNTQSQSPDQVPPDVAAQLDLWSTLHFNSIDDGLPVGGFNVRPSGSNAPFSLGTRNTPGTLDDLVRMGEEELVSASHTGGAFLFGTGSETVDPFHVTPQSQFPPAKKVKMSPVMANTSTAAAAVPKPKSRKSPDEEEEDPKDSETPLNAAEDKRRRNTAASARFRAKKKEREAALEKRAKELESRVGELERECEALRRENGWLKGLVVGVTQAGADLGVGVGTVGSLPIPTAQSQQANAGAKRKRE